MTTVVDISEAITFEEALQVTHTLLGHMETGHWSDAEVETTITQLVRTMNGARGFLVVYLTDDREICDRPSPAVIQALRSSPETVSSLMVKNMAMSTGQALSHQRNQDSDMAQKSQRVTCRVMHLIQQMHDPAIQAEAQRLQDTLTNGSSEYEPFLKRWNYDTEQRQAIQQAVSQLLAD